MGAYSDKTVGLIHYYTFSIEQIEFARINATHGEPR